jgi:hypothetical protein
MLDEAIRAVQRHNMIDKWADDGLIEAKRFYGDGPASMLKEPPVIAVRVVVGDTYVDDAIDLYPSERLVATIALLLQARGELC